MKTILHWLAQEWRDFWIPPKHDYGLRNPTPLWIKERTARRVTIKFSLAAIPLLVVLIVLLVKLGLI